MRRSIQANLRPYWSTCGRNSHPIHSANVPAITTRRLTGTNTSRGLGGGPSLLPRRRGHQPNECYLSSHGGAAAAPATTTGLFSIPELQEPSDFPRLAQQAIGSCNAIRTNIATAMMMVGDEKDPGPPANDVPVRSAILWQLDDISVHICNVIDAAELCRSVHADADWRDAAQRAFQTLSDFMGHLNGDRNLYNALQYVLMDMDDNKQQQLSDEDKIFATLLKAEFERDGIHLGTAGQQTVRDSTTTIGQLEGQFLHNLYHSNEMVTLSDATSILQLFDQTMLEQTYGATMTPQGGIAVAATHSNLLQTMYKYSDNPALRKEVYMAYATSLQANVTLLEELRRLRHELASTQGFPSFAHRTLSDRMVKTPETVRAFLQRAVAANQLPFRQDMGEIASAKKAVEKTSDPVEAWDVSFYEHLLEARDSEDVQAKIASYLTLPKTLEALQNLMHDLFGIAMTEYPLDRAERWDLSSTDDDDRTEATKLRKFLFSHEEQGQLGTLYLDLHPRESKYGHPAHYTVRCGCQRIQGQSLHQGQHQLPIVALVCNLSSRTGAISHGEVETIFHEMGHVVHSMLSRTKYQHLSGTRAAMDFVETPSQFLEQFACNERLLRDAFGVPDDCLQALMKSRAKLSSIETQTQLMYALFDQLLFGSEHQTQDSSSLFRSAHSELNLPYAEGTEWYARFGHLITYGASYYGYLYSKKFATELYQHVLDQGHGQNVWKKLLVYGGSKNPRAMLTDVLGRVPEV